MKANTDELKRLNDFLIGPATGGGGGGGVGSYGFLSGGGGGGGGFASRIGIGPGGGGGINIPGPGGSTGGGGGPGPGASSTGGGTSTGISDGGTTPGSSTGTGTGIPSQFASDVTAMTLAGAKPHNIQAYIKSHGIDVSVATCGQFMASVVKEHGGVPPKNPATASSWNKFGEAGYSSDPNAINVAVRQGTPTGASGSHVTAAIPIKDEAGNITGFRGVGVNQGNVSGPEHGVGQYGRDVITSKPITIGTGRGQYQIRHSIPTAPGGGTAPPVGAAAPGSGSGSLADVRGGFAEEMKNPAVRDRLMAYTQAEVGSQGPAAQQAFMESIMNRAASRGQSLAKTLSGRYFPGETHARAARGVSDAQREKYGPMADAVLGGSNISNYATGNASGTVGFGGGPKTFSSGGENFGIEGQDRKFMSGISARDIAHARQVIDKAEAQKHTVEGSGKITVDVNAPKGTNVGAEGKGLFKTVAINRQTQMEPARRGPVAADAGEE